MQLLRIPANWAAALDDVAGDLLARADISTPPVDCLALAERLGISVAYDASQRGRARHKRIAGRSTILLRPDPRPERLQWAAAHELGEAFVWQVFERAAQYSQSAADDDRDLPQLRESVASLMASRLLLPGRWFWEDARRTGWKLPELKRRYRTASHELIAFRFLDGSEPATISLFDQGRLVRRRSNVPACPRRPAEVERDCWAEVHRWNRPEECRSNGLIVQGWPVHEPGWKRELLRTTPQWDPEFAQLPPESAPGNAC